MRKLILGLGSISGVLMGGDTLPLEDELLIDQKDFDLYQKQIKSAKKLNHQKQNLDFRSYTVKKGDTLFKIALQEVGRKLDDDRGFKSLDFLLSYNPQIKNKDKIYIGDVIRIPDLKVRSEFLLGKNDFRKFHIVKKGDTLSRLSKKWMGLPFYNKNRTGSVELTIAANPQIKNPDYIEVGDIVFIPTKVNRIIGSEKQVLNFHFPKNNLFSMNMLLGSEAEDFAVKFDDPEEGHLIFNGI